MATLVLTLLLIPNMSVALPYRPYTTVPIHPEPLHQTWGRLAAVGGWQLDYRERLRTEERGREDLTCL